MNFINFVSMISIFLYIMTLYMTPYCLLFPPEQPETRSGCISSIPVISRRSPSLQMKPAVRFRKQTTVPLHQYFYVRFDRVAVTNKRLLSRLDNIHPFTPRDKFDLTSSDRIFMISGPN